MHFHLVLLKIMGHKSATNLIAFKLIRIKTNLRFVMERIVRHGELTPPKLDIEQGIQASFAQANALVLNKIDKGAATGLSVAIKPTGIFCGSCGDSLIEVYKLSYLKGWSWIASSQLDLLPDNRSPSQLIGSSAFHSANLFNLPPNGTYVILMMSDGVHGFTNQYERLQIIGKIKRSEPGNQDMQFISEELCQLAIKNETQDDASTLCMWIKFN